MCFLFNCFICSLDIIKVSKRYSCLLGLQHLIAWHLYSYGMVCLSSFWLWWACKKWTYFRTSSDFGAMCLQLLIPSTEPLSGEHRYENGNNNRQSVKWVGRDNSVDLYLYKVCSLNLPRLWEHSCKATKYGGVSDGSTWLTFFITL